MKAAAIVLFLLTYASLLAFPKSRAWIALASASVFVIAGILPVGKVFLAIDWNVLLMIAGSMGVVSLFIDSRMPELLADKIIDRMPDVKWAIVSLSLFAGIISAFVDNVATVLMVAPLALAMARKLKISPVHSIIAIALASNLQGAATLVGDTTSILLAGYAHLDFLDFFFFRGKPGMFWVVQAGAATSTLVLLYVFRRQNQRIHPVGDVVVNDYFPSWLLASMVLLLILASFIPGKIGITNGIICTSLFVLGLIRQYFVGKDHRLTLKTLGDIDYFTLLLLAGLFIVIGGITEAGVVGDISRIFVNLGHGNLFVIYTLIVWASVLFSAFIDNIPYIATMLPVTAGIASLMNADPALLYFGLLTGATLGGNLTPIGASANIAALGILRREGHNVSTVEFMRIGVPFTLAAVVAGYVLIWLIWN